jgi:NIPSNAP
MTTADRSRTVIPMRSIVMLFASAIGFLMNLHASAETRCCPVVELRQYTVKPGQRDVLIEIFDRHFIEGQESAGMTVIGQFRDRRRSDHFVWLRGFSDMDSRHKALAAFYDGPIWAAHKAAANDTMLDSDDVLLLRPARPETALGVGPRNVPSEVHERGPVPVLAGIYHVPPPLDTALVSEFEQRVAPTLQANGVHIEGIFVTEPSRNTFARLPIREDANVLVWFGTVARHDLSPERLEQLASMSALRSLAVSLLGLEPTSRSALGGGPKAARATKHDFDFLFGSWKVHNRYLKGRLRHSVEWSEFEARSDVEPVLNGLGNMDRYSAVRAGDSVEGVTLRLFNPATGEWSIHWADTVRPGTLLPPMVGRFDGEIGQFFGDEFLDGKKVLCRFLWTRTSSRSPQWEQAFSDDGGKTWETNWIMTFTRP